MRDRSPFHAGEQALQARVGARASVEATGRRMVRDFLLEQHRELFEELPFVVAGVLDDRDQPWATVLGGFPGFMRAPDAWTLHVGARPAAGEPAATGLVSGAPVGLLGIQPETRRRNRLNGSVTRVDERGFALHVGQSFGNCPKYIRAREPLGLAAGAVGRRRAGRTEGTRLSMAALALIRDADTFFIASASPGARVNDPSEGVDVSHRGGAPGFVRVVEPDGRTTLLAADYPGNRFFNTFGNLLRNPRAGLAFVDFARGHLLSLAGEADVLWDGPWLAGLDGAERVLRFRVASGVWIRDALPLRWSAPQP